MPELPELLTRRTHDPSRLCQLQQDQRIVATVPGVYLRADLAHDLVWQARSLVAWRPEAILCGQIAAKLSFWKELNVTSVDAIARTSVKRTGFRFHHRQVPPELIGSYGSFRLTLPALTSLDLAVDTDGDSIDCVLRSRLASLGDLQDALEQTRYRRGNGARRQLLLDSRAEPWSAAERLAHKILRAANIGGWRANATVQLRGQRYYLDIAFTHLKLVIEIDGRAFHSDAVTFESDRERQNALVLAGWTVLRFTYRMLTDQPDEVIAAIRTAIRRLQRPALRSGWC